MKSTLEGTSATAPDSKPLPSAISAEMKTKPVKWWAGVGALLLVFEVYVLAAWILSGDATPTPKGSTPVPDWMVVAVHTFEAIALGCLIVFFYALVLRPWRRERAVTLDGLLLGAFLLLHWQDPLFNFAQNHGTYNTEAINFGSWGPQVPGWLAPNGSLLAEPVLWISATYATAIFGVIILTNSVMRKVKAARPQIGSAGLVAVSFAFVMPTLALLECIWLRFGMYTFAGAIESLTLFHGHYYQYPIYEGVLTGLAFTVMACLRYFRNDKGQTFVERGIDDVKASRPQKNGLRFLALSGVLNVVFLALYSVPMQLFALHADPWPEDILKRSYLTDGMCGPGTSYSCSGPGVPVPRPNSAHLDPEGRLVVP